MKNIIILIFTLLILVPAVSKSAESNEMLQEVDEVRRAPLMSFAAYREALKSENPLAVKMLLNSETILQFDMFGYNASKMKFEDQTLDQCSAANVRIEGQRAVIYFDPKLRKCMPYFLIFEEGKWRIDLLTMSKVIVFDQNDEWKAVSGIEHPYSFIFSKKK